MSDIVEVMARGMRSHFSTDMGARAAALYVDDVLDAAGCAVVPKGPSEAMLNASWEIAGGQSAAAKANSHSRQCKAYTAMIEAADKEAGNE